MKEETKWVSLHFFAASQAKSSFCGGYVPVSSDKSHTRIIWDCAWAPEGDIFVTASRDKTVRVVSQP